MSSDNGTETQKPWKLVSLFASAGLTSGAGAIAGLFLGAGNEINPTQVALAVTGMLLLSGACAWLVKRSLRKHYIASLPFFWFTIGASLIVWLTVGKESAIAIPIALVLAVTAGRATGDMLLNYLHERDSN